MGATKLLPPGATMEHKDPDPLRELEQVLEDEVEEHTERAIEESRLAEKAEEELKEVRAEERKREHFVMVVVNGTEYKTPYAEDEILSELIERALKESGEVGQDPSKWQIKWDGKVLDPKEKIAKLHLPEKAVLFLSLEAGTLG
jgi:hypothetical protein